MQKTYPRSGVALFIVAAVFTALPTVAVALRIAGRRIKRVALWYDDFMIMASLVGCIRELSKKPFISLISLPFVMYAFMILMVLS